MKRQTPSPPPESKIILVQGSIPEMAVSTAGFTDQKVRSAGVLALTVPASVTALRRTFSESGAYTGREEDRNETVPALCGVSLAGHIPCGVSGCGP